MGSALLEPAASLEQKLSGSHKALVEMQDLVAELLGSTTREHPAAKVRRPSPSRASGQVQLGQRGGESGRPPPSSPGFVVVSGRTVFAFSLEDKTRCPAPSWKFEGW